MSEPSVYEDVVGLIQRCSGPAAELDPGCLILAAGLAKSLHEALMVRAEVLRRNLAEPCLQCGGLVEAHVRPGAVIVYACRKCSITALPLATMRRQGVER